MDIKDHKLTEISKVAIDFGTVDDEEYAVLCATAYGCQGRAAATNHQFDLIDSKTKWFEFWKTKAKVYTKTRLTAEFEFPSQQWLDAWMGQLPNYIKGISHEA